MMRALPAVTPRLERGHSFRSEYRWQETHCRTRGYHEVRPGCRCSDYHHIRKTAEHYNGPGPDNLVTGAEALRIVRRYLPSLRTEADLYRELAWSPVKVVLAPRQRSCYYTDNLLVVWAKARAAGRPAPWEVAQRKRAA